jgi:two-component system, NtrC family, sensor kinase
MPPRMPKGLRLSIRYKVLALVAAILLVAMGAYVAFAVRLFTRDKLAYVYDLNATLTGTLAEEVELTVAALVDKLVYFANEHEQTPGRDSAAQRLFAGDRDILSLELWTPRGEDWERRYAWQDAQRLAALNLGAADLREARKSRPISFAAVTADGVLLTNSSAPPDIALLTIAVLVPERGDVVVADVQPERFLRIFSQTEIFTAYLVDRVGAVLVHPDPKLLVSRASLAQRDIVRDALEAKTPRAVKAFIAPDGDSVIGAFARVDAGRVSIISEVPEAQALAAARDLVRQSVLFAIGSLLFGFLLSIFFSRQLAAPLRHLESATQRVAAGDFGVDVRVSSRDEVGNLATAFNSMANQLRDRDHRLSEAHEQLVQSEKLATIGEMSAGISHEVKNPLAGMRGFAQLGKRAKTLEETKEYFALIENETFRAIEILENLLKFSRAERNEMSELNVNDVVRDAVRLVSHQLQIKNVRVELKLADDLPKILGNGNQLRQVLVNLAINAQHAMEGVTGQLVLTTTTDGNGRILVSVRDNGHGMTAEVKQRLFKPFFTTKVMGKGTGLGLSVSQRIVDAHRGQITVESEVGKGTVFTIALPTVSAVAPVIA